MEYIVQDSTQSQEILTIGISGGSASGKSEIATLMIGEIIKRASPGTQIFRLGMDGFYKNLPQTANAATYNFDHPDSVDIDEFQEVLVNLKTGKQATIPHYDFVSHKRSHNVTNLQINPFAKRVIIIIEGIFAFDQLLTQHYDDKIWIHADTEIRLARRISRDTRERGRTEKCVKEQWVHTVQKTFEQFERIYQQQANQTITNNNQDYEEIIQNFVIPYVAKLLKK